MSKYETKFGEYFNLPNPGLRAYFDRVRSGQPDEYRTPFYKGKSLKTILAPWLETLKRIRTEWPTLYDYEIDLSKKVGPMSIQAPLSQRMDDIRSYYDLVSLDQVPLKKEALAACLDEWKGAFGLRLRSESKTVGIMKKSTNSGSPYFSKRSAVLSKTVPIGKVQMIGKYCRQELPTGDWDACAVLGWRGQEGGPESDDVKQRVVWMFPFAVNVKELQLYQPLIEAFQHFNYVPAWVGTDAVDLAVTRMFDSKAADDLVICTDFSKFDQHFNPTCQEAASQLLTALMTHEPASAEWIEHIFPIKYAIPLAFDWGKIMYGAHGMGSGSGGTNADETLVHRALQHEVALASGTVLNPNSQCLGDDGIITYPGCTVEDVIRSYTAHGLEMNPDKQYASTQDCIYLRRWHHRDYRINGVCAGVYSTCRALGRLAEQERYYDPDKWGPKMVCLRYLSILENVKYHPLREEFADYCIKGDKYRLGIDIPGFLDNIGSEAEKAIEEIPDFMGYTQQLDFTTKRRSGRNTSGCSATGIENWWIVNYLKSKA